MTASEALQQAAVTALRGIGSLGVYELAPVQAAFPHALVETGPETDWGHKSGAGRELRLAVTLRDAGERPVRLRTLAGEAEAAVAAVGRDLPGWRVVTLHFLRTRMVREAKGWAAVIEFRARMLAS